MKTREQVHKNMSSVRSRDSKIEKAFRLALWHKGFRYSKNCRSVFGCPDIVNRKYRIAIFIDSEFWHGYNWLINKNQIKSNVQFWVKKIESNIARDYLVNEHLSNEGWLVLRVWGEVVRKELDDCIDDIVEVIAARKLEKARTGAIRIYPKVTNQRGGL